MIRYALIAALLGCLGLGAYALLQGEQLDAAEADVARLKASVAALEEQAAQARAAAEVAKATAAREAARAAAMSNVREAFRNGDFDEELSPDFLDRLRDLGLR